MFVLRHTEVRCKQKEEDGVQGRDNLHSEQFRTEIVRPSPYSQSYGALVPGVSASVSTLLPSLAGCSASVCDEAWSVSGDHALNV